MEVAALGKYAHQNYKEIHFTPISLAAIKNTESVGEDVEKLEPLCTVLGM